MSLATISSHNHIVTVRLCALSFSLTDTFLRKKCFCNLYLDDVLREKLRHVKLCIGKVKF